jgi:hypothetical protein
MVARESVGQPIVRSDARVMEVASALCSAARRKKHPGRETAFRQVATVLGSSPKTLGPVGRARRSMLLGGLVRPRDARGSCHANHLFVVSAGVWST